MLANHKIRLAGSALLFEGLDIGGATPSLFANAEELPSAGSGKGGSAVISIAGNDSNADHGTQARSDTYLRFGGSTGCCSLLLYITYMHDQFRSQYLAYLM